MKPSSTGRNRSRSARRGVSAILLACVALGAVACGGAATTMTADFALVDGYAVVAPRAVPPDIASRPSAPYRHQRAFLVDGQWYLRSDAGWVVFAEEPRRLRRARRQIERGI